MDVVLCKHIENEEIIEAIAVDIGEINAHREEAGLAQSQAIDGAKSAASLVEPDAVGTIKVVADVNIGKTVAIDIANHHGQPPVEERLGQRMSVFVEECATGKRDRNEVCSSHVFIEDVDLALFINAAA